MPDRDPSGTGPSEDTAAERAATSQDTPARRLAPDELRCRADLIAAGRDEFPVDLPPSDRDRLWAEVRRRRRDRLVRHVARAIALDLWRAAQPSTEESC